MIAAVGLTLMATAAAQTKGPNGGIVVKVDDHPIEFVVRDQEIVFYLGDHDGKPMPTKGLKARAVVQDGGKTVDHRAVAGGAEHVRRQARRAARRQGARGVLERFRRPLAAGAIRRAMTRLPAAPPDLPARCNCDRSPAISCNREVRQWTWVSPDGPPSYARRAAGSAVPAPPHWPRPGATSSSTDVTPRSCRRPPTRSGRRPAPR